MPPQRALEAQTVSIQLNLNLRIFCVRISHYFLCFGIQNLHNNYQFIVFETFIGSFGGSVPFTVKRGENVVFFSI